MNATAIWLPVVRLLTWYTDSENDSVSENDKVLTASVPFSKTWKLQKHKEVNGNGSMCLFIGQHLEPYCFHSWIWKAPIKMLC